MGEAVPEAWHGRGKAARGPDNHFPDLVVSINTLHNSTANYDHLREALKEMQRVGKGGKYLCVEAYHLETSARRCRTSMYLAAHLPHLPHAEGVGSSSSIKPTTLAITKFIAYFE